jgi:hypothetical protein
VITKMGFGKMAAFNSRVNGTTYAVPIVSAWKVHGHGESAV